MKDKKRENYLKINEKCGPEGEREKRKMLVKEKRSTMKWNKTMGEKQFSFMNSCLTEGQEYEQLKLNKLILICLANCDWSYRVVVDCTSRNNLGSSIKQSL